jgi:hypothetical protein
VLFYLHLQNHFDFLSNYLTFIFQSFKHDPNITRSQEVLSIHLTLREFYTSAQEELHCASFSNLQDLIDLTGFFKRIEEFIPKGNLLLNLHFAIKNPAQNSSDFLSTIYILLLNSNDMSFYNDLSKYFLQTKQTQMLRKSSSAEDKALRERPSLSELISNIDHILDMKKLTFFILDFDEESVNQNDILKEKLIQIMKFLKIFSQVILSQKCIPLENLVI